MQRWYASRGDDAQRSAAAGLNVYTPLRGYISRTYSTQDAARDGDHCPSAFSWRLSMVMRVGILVLTVSVMLSRTETRAFSASELGTLRCTPEPTAALR